MISQLDHNIFNGLKKAMAKDVLVFDFRAVPGVLSRRLVILMKEVFSSYYYTQMNFLYISTNAMDPLYALFDSAYPVIEDICIKDMADCNQEYLRALGASPATIGVSGKYFTHNQDDTEFVFGSDKDVLDLRNKQCDCILGSI